MTYIDYFKEICSMPHGSGNTKIISDWLVKFAVDHGLEYHQDAANNVIIIREASKGCEDKPPVIIQGHMDMVAVHDADRDIDMEKEGLDITYRWFPKGGHGYGIAGVKWYQIDWPMILKEWLEERGW